MIETPTGLPDADPDISLETFERQVDLYDKGRRLRKFTQDLDWELVIQILQDYKDNASDALDNLPPGHPNVMQAHAAVSATKQVLVNFQRYITAAVEFAEHPPEEFKSRMLASRDALDVSKAMEAVRQGTENQIY